MFNAVTEIRVRYAETDQMGYVYYGHYPTYYEVGRAEAIRSLGLTYKLLESKGVLMPVQEMSVRYLRPALYDDLIRVHTALPKLEQEQMTFETTLKNEADKIINQGSTTLVFVDGVSRKRIPMPIWLYDLLAPYYQE